MNRPDLDHLPARLGSFELRKKIGSGAQADVYLAWQESMHRQVAVKVLRGTLASDPDFLSRFHQEAALIAQLEHPHILPVHDAGEEGGVPWIAMRFVDGQTLEEVTRSRRLAFAQVLELLRQIGSALDHAHRRGVVHRDVKPANILTDGQGNFLLADFGIAKMLEGGAEMTLQGRTFGTAHYMSPEQCKGQNVRGSSDLYSLGIVLYALLLGELPFHGDTAQQVQLKQIHVAPGFPADGIPGAPRGTEGVLRKALAKEPAARFGTAADMLQAFVELQRAGAPDSVSDSGHDTCERADAAPDGLTSGAASGLRARMQRGARFYGSAAAAGVVAGLLALGAARAAPTGVIVCPGETLESRPAPIPLPQPWTSWPKPAPLDQRQVTLAVLVGDGIQSQSGNGLAAAVEQGFVAPLRVALGDRAAVKVRPANLPQPPGSSAWLSAARAEGADLALVLDAQVGQVVIVRPPPLPGARPEFGVPEHKVTIALALEARLVPRHDDPGEPLRCEPHGEAQANAAEYFARALDGSGAELAGRVEHAIGEWRKGVATHGNAFRVMLVTSPSNQELHSWFHELLRHLPMAGAEPDVRVIEADFASAETGLCDLGAGRRVELTKGSQWHVWSTHCMADAAFVQERLVEGLKVYGSSRTGTYLGFVEEAKVYVSGDLLVFVAI